MRDHRFGKLPMKRHRPSPQNRASPPLNLIVLASCQDDRPRIHIQHGRKLSGIRAEDGHAAAYPSRSVREVIKLDPLRVKKIRDAFMWLCGRWFRPAADGPSTH